MPVRKDYLERSDLTGFAAVTAILEKNGQLAVQLSNTLFHPQGGGQKADTGLIGGARVTGVRHAGDSEVDHLLGERPEFQVGETVAIGVDPENRARNARWYSAGHLLADAAHMIRPALRAVAGHHWPGEARVEFEGEVLDEAGFCGELQSRLEELIGQDLPFKIVGDPFSNRAIQIGEFEPIGCGGTHVGTTAELSGLTILSVRVKRGRLRVSYGMG